MSATHTTPHAVAHSAARQSPSFALLAAGVVGFTLLTALGAQAAWPAPGSPVPYTLQSLVVMLAAMLLGPRLGMLSMLFYVALGTAGYHVFATGNFGLRTIFGPTGGYLLGFIVAQPVIGLLSRPGRGLWLRLPAGLLAGNAVLFACGLAWLHVWTSSLAGASWAATLSLGLLPFLPDLAVKMAIAYALGLALVPTLRPVFDRA